jgi:hypothetical protein
MAFFLLDAFATMSNETVEEPASYRLMETESYGFAKWREYGIADR